jgi:hypothetical protein
MIGEYTFETTTVDGVDYVVANPVGNGELVRMEAEWIEGEHVEGKWEDAVRAVLDTALFDAGTVGDGTVHVGRSTAVDALAETLDGVRHELQADALVAYLASVDVWRLDLDDVVVLRDPRECSLSGREVLTWAMAVDVCIERVDAVREALEQSVVDTRERSNADSTLDSLRQSLEVRGNELRVRGLYERDFPDDATTMVTGFGDIVGTLRSDDPVDAAESLEAVASELADVEQGDAAVEDTLDDPISIVESMEALVSELADAEGVDGTVEAMSDEEVEEEANRVD